jgi:ABC-type Fe3+ transport system permease subunit
MHMLQALRFTLFLLAAVTVLSLLTGIPGATVTFAGSAAGTLGRGEYELQSLSF